MLTFYFLYLYKISQKEQKLFNIYNNENNEFKYESSDTESGEYYVM